MYYIIANFEGAGYFTFITPSGLIKRRVRCSVKSQKIFKCREGVPPEMINRLIIRKKIKKFRAIRPTGMKKA